MRLAMILSAASSLVGVVVFAAGAARAGGVEYPVPENGDNVIGLLTTAVAAREDTLLDIGQRHGVGYEEIIAAMPSATAREPS